MKAKKKKTPAAPRGSTLDTLADAAKVHAARRLGNPDAAAHVTPDAADFLAAARDTGNALVVEAAREELGQ